MLRFFQSRYKAVKTYLKADEDYAFYEDVATTPPRNVHDDLQRLQRRLRQMRSLPRYDEAGPTGKAILLAASVNQYLTRAGTVGLVGDILLPSLDAIVDGMSPAVMVSLLALDTPEPELVGLWGQRIGYGWTAANLVWHLWHRHRSVSIQFVEETMFSFGRCMRNLARAPLWGVDYMLRFMRWNSRRIGEFSIAYLATHMLADTLVGYIQRLERAEYTALDFAAEAVGIAVPVLALILLRKMNVPAWQREVPPVAVQILDRAMQRVPVINSALAWSKRHPAPFNLAHGSGQFLYNTAIFHAGFSAAYFLGILVVGHTADLEERLITQGITFAALSIPAGGVTTMTMYVLGTENCCVRNNRLMTHATQDNLYRLGDRAVRFVPRVAVPAVSAAIMAEYILHDDTDFNYDGILAVATAGGVLVVASAAKITADVLKNCLRLSREAAIEHAKLHGQAFTMDGETYYASGRAAGYINYILNPFNDLSNFFVDRRSPGFTPYDLELIEIAWDYRRKHGLSALNDAYDDISMAEDVVEDPVYGGFGNPSFLGVPNSTEADTYHTFSDESVPVVDPDATSYDEQTTSLSK